MAEEEASPTVQEQEGEAVQLEDGQDGTAAAVAKARRKMNGKEKRERREGKRLVLTNGGWRSSFSFSGHYIAHVCSRKTRDMFALLNKRRLCVVIALLTPAGWIQVFGVLALTVLHAWLVSKAFMFLVKAFSRPGDL